MCIRDRKYISNISSKKLSKGLRLLIIIGLIFLAILFAIGGRFLLTLPLTLASLALLKLKGLSIFQLISLFRLIQTLRRSGRFSFNQTQNNNMSTMSVSEAFKILNLDQKKGYQRGYKQSLHENSKKNSSRYFTRNCKIIYFS